MGRLARDAAAHAVRANPNLAESQVIAGYVNWLLDWDWTAAETAFRRAIRLDPSSAAAYRALGHALSQSGRQSEAESAMRRTRELEPLEPMNYALSSQVAFQAREYPAAVEHARRAILTDSELWIGYMELGQAYERTGDTDLALEALDDAARLSGGNSKPISLRGYLLAKSGRASEAREVLRRLEADAGERYVPPYAMALVHAGLGDARVRVRVARQSLRRARRPPDLSACRSEVGSVPGRSPLHRTPRPVWLHAADRETDPQRSGLRAQGSNLGAQLNTNVMACSVRLVGSATRNRSPLAVTPYSETSCDALKFAWNSACGTAGSVLSPGLIVTAIIVPRGVK